MIKYVAAVSGGPDSMSMLDMFKKQIALVCHVNYNKRITAQRDARIVEDYCKKNKLKLEVLNVTDEMYKQYKELNNNFQATARAIRYDFFNSCANKAHLDTVLIAHTMDDFLETAMMQKKRNSASLFLGIHEKSVYKTINIYRPLLNK
jgi:tRNA(Ile)-lysidine synthase